MQGNPLVEYFRQQYDEQESKQPPPLHLFSLFKCIKKSIHFSLFRPTTARRMYKIKIKNEYKFLASIL